MHLEPQYQNKVITGVYLEELSVIVHEKEHQGFTLRSSQFLILNQCSLKGAADQGPVISLIENNKKKQSKSEIIPSY